MSRKGEVSQGEEWSQAAVATPAIPNFFQRHINILTMSILEFAKMKQMRKAPPPVENLPLESHISPKF